MNNLQHKIDYMKKIIEHIKAKILYAKIDHIVRENKPNLHYERVQKRLLKSLTMFLASYADRADYLEQESGYIADQADQLLLQASSLLKVKQPVRNNEGAQAAQTFDTDLENTVQTVEDK